MGEPSPAHMASVQILLWPSAGVVLAFRLHVPEGGGEGGGWSQGEAEGGGWRECTAGRGTKGRALWGNERRKAVNRRFRGQFIWQRVRACVCVWLCARSSDKMLYKLLVSLAICM